MTHDDDDDDDDDPYVFALVFKKSPSLRRSREKSVKTIKFHLATLWLLIWTSSSQVFRKWTNIKLQRTCCKTFSRRVPLLANAQFQERAAQGA